MEKDVYNHIVYALEKTKSKISNKIGYGDYEKTLKYYQLFICRTFLGLETLNGLILFWETGFGKTLTAAHMINNIDIFYPNWKIYIFIKAALYEDPWFKTLNIYCRDKLNNITFIHYDSHDAQIKFYQDLNSLKKTDRIFFIIDEGHNFISKVIPKNKGERKFKMMFNKICSLSNKQYNKILFMSATPIYNQPIEFDYILQLIRKDIVYFNERFFVNQKLTNFKELSEGLYGICSYNKLTEGSVLEVESGTDDIVKKNIYYHKVIMSSSQSSIYERVKNYELKTNARGFRTLRRMVACFAMDDSKIKEGLTEEKYNSIIKNNLSNFKKLINDISFSKCFIEYFINDDLDNYPINNQNNIIEKNNYKTLYSYSCKYIKTCQLILRSKGKVIVYIPFVSFEGISTLVLYFKIFGITYVEFSGNTGRIRDINLDKFNSIDNIKGNIYKVCVFSGAGSEGISFNSVLDTIILDIPWSGSEFEQIVGRGRRLYSHKQLSNDLQYINVHIIISQDLNGSSIEEEMLQIIKEKEIERLEINRLLKNVSLENIYKKYFIDIIPSNSIIEEEFKDKEETVFNILRKKKIVFKNEVNVFVIKKLKFINYTYENSNQIYQGYLDENTDLVYVNQISVAKVKRNKDTNFYLFSIIDNKFIYICDSL